jgi:Protein of unknown function (DUF541)
MRSVSLAFLAMLALVAPGLARLPDETAQKASVEPLADGITLTASGAGRRFMKHTLTLTVKETNGNSAALSDDRREFILARRSAIVAAMTTLGLKLLPESEFRGGIGGFGGGRGGFGGSSVSTQLIFGLPDGACDGTTLAGHPYKKVVEAAVKAGAQDSCTLSSERDDYREALEDAMKNGRESAAMLAKAAGVTLGRLQAIRVPLGYGIPSPFTMPRYLTLTTTEITPPAGQSGGIFATLELRFAIR